MANRYCANGEPLNIANLLNVGQEELTRSVWDIVNTIHISLWLDITFVDDHSAQMKIAIGFRTKSSIDIPYYVGSIDDLLI